MEVIIDELFNPVLSVVYKLIFSFNPAKPGCGTPMLLDQWLFFIVLDSCGNTTNLILF